MSIREECTAALMELCDVAGLKPGDIIVIGCSTSEVGGSKIGTNSSEDIAKELYDAIAYVSVSKRIYPAFQCCEHLNRAIVIERECMPVGTHGACALWTGAARRVCSSGCVGGKAVCRRHAAKHPAA